MPSVVAIKFSNEEMPTYYRPGQLAGRLKVQDFCVVQRDDIEAVGFVAAIETWAQVQLDTRHEPIPEVIRHANDTEKEKFWEWKAFERKALVLCKEKVFDSNLPMKVSRVRYEPKNHKLFFHFTSEKRVDFRALVKDLGAMLHCRIELWQIGPREESRILDGFGVCGLRTCCSSWIKDFHPVNLKMAREQDLELPPTKLTGQCGRLLCCLAYELDAYRDLSKEALPRGTTVIHEAGKGVVVDRNLIKKTYLVADETGKLSTIAASTIKESKVPEQLRETGKKMSGGDRESGGGGRGRGGDRGDRGERGERGGDRERDRDRDGGGSGRRGGGNSRRPNAPTTSSESDEEVPQDE
jgi:cell fate regulator YaaT (PSP1 superfamily)